VQNCHRRIEDLLVQRLRSVDVYQFSGDVLKALGGVKLHREHLLTLSVRLFGGFQLAGLLSHALWQF
jgi:hypothetical protein